MSDPANIRGMLIPREFKQAILALAPLGFEARAIAPATFAQVMECERSHGRVIVWEGASDGTIYSDPKVNHAFRAWHDACHIAGEHGFTLDGERATCERQIASLRIHFPRAPIFIDTLLRAEVIGQAEHFARTGEFPADQAAFIADYLRGAL